MSSWGNMVEGAQCITGCTEGVPGNLNPAYAAARDVVGFNPIESNSGSHLSALNAKNGNRGPRI